MSTNDHPIYKHPDILLLRELYQAQRINKGTAAMWCSCTVQCLDPWSLSCPPGLGGSISLQTKLDYTYALAMEFIRCPH